MKIFAVLREKWIPADAESSTLPQIITIIIVSIAQVNVGLLYAWSSPYFTQLLSETSPIPTTFEDTANLLMTTLAARAISAPISAIMVDIIGRRDTIILTNIPYTLAWILIYLADSLPFLYISRFLTGLADAAIFTAVPMYIGEISEPNVRGTWGSLPVVSAVLGQLIINTVGIFWDMRTSALAFSFLPVVLGSVCLLVPRSPYYLTMKKRDTEAVSSLRRLQCKQDVEKEFGVLQKVVQRQTEEKGTFLDLFRMPSNRKAVLINLASRSVQQFSGMPVFVFYTRYIFQESGGTVSESFATITYTAFFLICTAVSTYLMGKLGRKSAMILSTTTCALFLMLEAEYFFMKQHDYGIDMESFGWVPLAGMVGYIISSAFGMTLVPTVMLSELFPVSVKGKAMCLNNLTSALNALIVSKVFQWLASSYGMFAPFTFFSVCCTLGIVFSVIWLPETKGRTLDEIQEYLKCGKFSIQ